MSKIIFVALMKNPLKDASSTQIMTSNLLYGFKSIGMNVVFAPLVFNEEDKEYIKLYYQPFCNKVICLNFVEKYKNNILRQISWLIHVLFPQLIKLPRCLLDEIDSNTILISQSPHVDAAVVCKNIKRIYPDVSYIQYWGDPLALSLITPKEYTTKRFLLKIIERNLHSCSDRIVYGTGSLFMAQNELYPEAAYKSFKCDVCYLPKTILNNKRMNNYVFGYFGNYYSNIRNILPLYEAFNCINNANLIICGSSDLNLSSTNNVYIRSRVSQAEAEKEEALLDVEICILNSVGIQIPGKIFYHTNTNRIILVILDGPQKDNIKNELSESNRFVFCDNNSDDICRVIKEITSGYYDDLVFDPEFYSPEAVCSQILGE